VRRRRHPSTILLLPLLLPLQPTRAVVIDLFLDADCTSPAGRSMAVQPGSCFAWANNGFVVACDPTVGPTNITLFESAGVSDTTPPLCAGTDVMLTAEVTSACGRLPVPLSYLYTRVADPACSLGSGPAYQAAIFSEEGCNATSPMSVDWNTLAVRSGGGGGGVGTACVTYPAGATLYSWDAAVSSSPTANSSFDLNFYSGPVCNTFENGWVGVQADGTCNAPISGPGILKGLRVLVPVPYTPPAPPPPPPAPLGGPDYLVALTYGDLTCSGDPYAYTVRFPGCTVTSPSASTRIRCGGNSSSAVQDDFTGSTTCEGTPSSSTPVPGVGSGCTVAGSSSSSVIVCVGPSLGYPAFRPLASGYVSTSYGTTSCSEPAEVTTVSRYPVGTCIATAASTSARFTCGSSSTSSSSSGAVITQSTFSGRACEGAPTAVTNPTSGCSIGASSSTSVACLGDVLPVTAATPPPPTNYAPTVNASSSRLTVFSLMSAGQVGSATAGFNYIGSNGANPFLVTAVVFNPTGANMTLRAGGGPSCSRFDDTVYVSGRNVAQGANLTTFSLFNMPCITPASLIVTGQPNYCCLLLECHQASGCPYAELGTVQYRFVPSEDASGAGGGGAAAGGVLGTGFGLLLILLVLHCTGCIHIPCFDRCCGGGGVGRRRHRKATFATSESSRTTTTTVMTTVGPGAGAGLSTGGTAWGTAGSLPAPTTFYPSIHSAGLSSSGRSTVAPPASSYVYAAGGGGGGGTGGMVMGGGPRTSV
jgi:hypothetical protein